MTLKIVPSELEFPREMADSRESGQGKVTIHDELGACICGARKGGAGKESVMSEEHRSWFVRDPSDQSWNNWSKT